MSLSIKIGLSFALLLIFTLLVASISWYGTTESIGKQNEIYVFSSDLKQQFYRLAMEERNYSTEKQPKFAQNVFSLISSVRAHITQQPMSSRIEGQQPITEEILLALDGYEDTFLLYTRSVIDFEALESRLYKELDKLAAATSSFLRAQPDKGDAINDRIMQILLYNLRSFSLSFNENTRAYQLPLIAELTSLTSIYPDDGLAESAQLQAFRLNRSLGVFQDALEKYYDIQVQLKKNKGLLQQQLAALHGLAEEYISHRRSSLEHNTLRYMLAALAVTLFSGLLTLCAAFYLSRKIVVPLASLKQSALQVVRGNLDTTVAVQSRDEIGDLSGIFNEMTNKLRRSFAELERYKNHLETLVARRTAELSERVEEKELAEKSLLSSQKNIQSIIDQIPVGIILLDEHLIIQQWNPAAQKIFGYSHFEALGEHTSFIVDDEAKSKVEDVFARITESKEPVRSKNHNRTRSGRVILCDWYNAPFLDHNNEITGIISIVEDITEQEKDEKEHLKIAKLEAAGLLAGGIAHDFNNILTAILGNINLALTDTALKENTRKLLLNSEKASIRAKSLTEQLLTFAKGGDPIKETTTLQDIIEESASFVLHGGNVTVEYDFGDNVWPVEADKGQISQVIQNIILNARDAMPAGGTVHLGCRNLYNSNTIPELDEERLIHLTIKDHGVGVPEDLLQRIFDPYFTTKKDGSGLGLAVTYSIVQKHGGHIEVESQPNVGTTFHIYLPASTTQYTQVEARPGEGEAEVPWKILIMDDEEMVLAVLEKMLSAQGHTVLRCGEGRHCLEIFAEELARGRPVDLTIMDLTIPGGMGGRETAGKILQLQADARIIVASGYSNDPIMSTYRSYGFTAALAKPFTSQEVRSVIVRLQKRTNHTEKILPLHKRLIR